VIQFTTQVASEGNCVHVTKPKDKARQDSLMMLIEKAWRVKGGSLSVRFDLPRRPRTTGPRKQNNRFYGHCDDLAEQVLDENGEPKYTQKQIHDAMLRMSVPEGYPTYLDLNGVETPLPSAQSTVENMSLVSRTIQRFADIHGFWLHEYVADGPHKGEVYRSIGGRSFEEMEKYEKAASPRS
jgi:hypothetical protein